jgi:hypothetical protein
VEYDFNILRFVEHNYGIAEGALTFADRRATKGADYFLHDRTTMEPPDTD